MTGDEDEVDRLHAEEAEAADAGEHRPLQPAHLPRELVHHVVVLHLSVSTSSGCFSGCAEIIRPVTSYCAGPRASGVEFSVLTTTEWTVESSLTGCVKTQDRTATDA